jgi:hypothetical protein
MKIVQLRSAIGTFGLFCLIATMAGVISAAAQDDQAIGTDFAVTRDDVPDKDPVYSPFVGQAHPDRVYWGETHPHTSWSTGALAQPPISARKTRLESRISVVVLTTVIVAVLCSE